MFLGIGANVTNWNAEATACVVVLETNPLADFVELPEHYRVGLYKCVWNLKKLSAIRYQI